jgi:hypothetical protein
MTLPLILPSPTVLYCTCAYNRSTAAAAISSSRRSISSMSRRYVAVTVETPHLITVSGPIDHKIAGKLKKNISPTRADR